MSATAPGGSTAPTFTQKLYDSYSTYTTLQVVKVKSFTLASVHHGFQLLIVTYFIGFVLLFRHGYQKKAPVDGGVELKVKGMAMYNGKVHDATDLVYPSKEKDALFITTRFLDTPEQHRGVCRSSFKKDVCNTAADCPKGTEAKSKIGTYTGVCAGGGCQVTSWCPTENKAEEGKVLPEIANFTVFARTNVDFYDGQTMSNLLNETDGQRATKLLKGMNLFKIKDILELAGENYSAVAKMGGAFSLRFDWDCDLDWGAQHCRPKIGVQRLDDPHTTFASGSNFRYAHYWKSANGTDFRYLRKAYGIRILYSNTGMGRGFDAATAAIVLGSAFALLKIATAVADFVALSYLPKKLWFQSVIVKQAYEEDADAEQDALIGKKDGAGSLYGTAAGKTS